MIKKIIVGILIFIAVLLNLYCLTARGEEELQEAWILCYPDSCVLIREYPKKKSQVVGDLQCGDKFYTDGKVVNGFLHCYDLAAECSEAWVAEIYVVYNEPYTPMFPTRDIITTTRVAVRKTMNGKVIKWLYDGDRVTVYVISDEWCVTNYGYIMTEFIDVGSCTREKIICTDEEMIFEDD